MFVSRRYIARQVLLSGFLVYASTDLERYVQWHQKKDHHLSAIHGHCSDAQQLPLQGLNGPSAYPFQQQAIDMLYFKDKQVMASVCSIVN
jgi:hypothetical protein